jgi:hypothetical protein
VVDNVYKGDGSWLPRKAQAGRTQLEKVLEIEGPTILRKQEMKQQSRVEQYRMRLS